MATKLSFYGLLATPVAIVNPGDAVDVDFAALLVSPGGIVMPQTELVLLLNNLTPATDQWNGLQMHLFLDSLIPNPTTPLASFVTAEATFTGYAAQALVWLAAENQPNNNARLPSTRLQFLSTAVPNPQNVVGFFATHP